MRTALWIIMALDVAGSLSADEDWWQLRGPTGEGHTSAQRLPLTWSEYLNVFRAIVAKGYTGFLGLEMWPTVDPTQAIRESISLLAEATAERK
jgi:sugar phosphate isomerase/epimerase